MKNVVGFLWIQCVHKKNCSKDTSCVICVVRACRCGRHRFLSLIGNCGISPFAIQTVWQAGLISIFYCFIYTPDHMRRAHRDFGSQIWRFNQDFNFSSLCYFFCLYGGTEIEEGRIRHILLRVYSAAPEIREMAWNSTHTTSHYLSLNQAREENYLWNSYFMQHLASLWIMYMDVTLCFNSNFTTPLNALQKKSLISTFLLEISVSL